MLLSYNELKKLNVKQDIHEVENMFFQLGHEVEELIEYQNDKLVIGKIIEIKKHENADKLNVCQVDVGDETLQIVCGAPNAAIDKYVIVALVGSKILGHEIKKAELKGVESNGMLCSLEELGFSKNVLKSEDYEGIHLIQEKVEVGDNAYDALGIKDTMLDIFLTANRGDCQSYRGLYNDISALINYNNDNKNLKKYDIKHEVEFSNDIQNTYKVKINEGSKYFSYCAIEGVDVTGSDWSTKLFLLKHNIKSQNNITDISNKNLLKYGIPSHIYDADKIEGDIRVELLKSEEPFIGLDEKEILLPMNTLVIRDSKKIICVAGTMGSHSTRVDENTKNILVEVAHFEYSNVFFNSKVLGKKTEASLRYEKQIDLSIIDDVMNSICNEIVEVTKAKASDILKVGSVDIIKEPIFLKEETIEKILGIKIDKNSIIKILENLEFVVREVEGELVITPPNYRNDIFMENDLIEEIIRVYNIDNIIPSSNIVSFSNIDKIIPNTIYDNLRNIENMLLKDNLNQIVSYSLISEKNADKFVLNKKDKVKLMHPLSNEHAVYRQSLISSLIQIAKDNYSYQEKSNAFFEIAKTYHLEGEEIIETNKLALLVSGEYENYYTGSKRKYNFYDLKIKVENLLNVLDVDYEFKPFEDIAELNPYASAAIISGGKEIGIIGEVVFDYDKKIKEALYVAEINLDSIIEVVNNKDIKKYEKISFLPKIQRDLTLEVARELTYEEMIKSFENINFLIDVLILDVYTGENIDPYKKSVTFRLIFQSSDETLTKEQIDVEINKIIDYCNDNGFKISGV